MEDWLHFGTKKKVEKQYKIVEGMKFPEPPEEDELYDLFVELVELDGYVMGVASKYIKSGILTERLFHCDAEFLNIQHKINIKSQELDNILRYKEELDKLIVMLG